MIAVGGAAARVDKQSYAGLHARSEHIPRTFNVNLIEKRSGVGGLPCHHGGEMHHCRDLRSLQLFA